MNPIRRPLIAGNWKMNAGGQDGCALADAVAKATKDHTEVDVVVAPPFTALAAVAHVLDENKSKVTIAAQNMHHEPSGAFTGEISSSMLKESGASWVILGHSERRQLFGETDEMVARKVASAIAAGIRPIACVGETLDQRDAEATLEVVARQVRAFIDELARQPGFGVIAYEPVWAIGTGLVATPEDAQAVHAMIRSMLVEASEELAQQTRILYGGSVKGDNAEGLLDQADIDGALVGGASLDAAGFAKIVDAAQRLAPRADQG
ncbi:MAG: triose-phosphate isomerase [Byssovorax sp.]